MELLIQRCFDPKQLGFDNTQTPRGQPAASLMNEREDVVMIHGEKLMLGKKARKVPEGRD